MSAPLPTHARVAEAGKLLALKGDHVGALMHYREAMQQGAQCQAPPILMRHYSECAVESLELAGHYEDVLRWCDQALEHYKPQLVEQASALVWRDCAHILQRRGVVLLKLEALEESAATLREARSLAERVDDKLPLAATLLSWLKARVHISPDRLLQEQKRAGYFAIYREKPDPTRALLLKQGGPPSTPTPSTSR